MNLKVRPELTILIILGFVLRIIGTNPGYYAHGDEIMYGEAVYMLLNQSLGMEPQILGYYPPLVAWVMLVFFVLIFIPITIIAQMPQLLADSSSPAHFFNNYVLGVNWANAMYWGRYTTVIFSTGAIVLTYFLSQKIFKKRFTAFLAALFVTVNYRLILNSKIGFLDIYSAFFLLLALLAYLYLYEKPTYKNYLISWITVGLSFLVKYQIYAIPAFLFIHFLISLKLSKYRPKKILKIFLNKGFVVGGAICILLVASSHYYHFQNLEKVKSIYEYQALKYGLGVNNLNIYPVSYIYHIMLGPFLTFALLGGLFAAVFQKKYIIGAIPLAIVLAFNCFIYFYYSTGGTYTRNLLVILPIALIFSAFSFNLIWEFLIKKFKLRFAATLLLITLIFLSVNQQLKNSLVAIEVLSKPSARILIENWINDNIPSGAKIGIYSGSFSPDENEFSIKTFTGVNESLSSSELMEEGVEYSIVDFHIVNSSHVWWMGQPTDIGLKFWNKPDNLLSQSYTALAIRELLSKHTIQAYLPKWQSPGYNYAVIKLGEQVKGVYLSLNNYSFDFDTQGWKKIYYFEEIKNLLTYSDESDSLVILNENIPPSRNIRRIYSRPGAVRWESPVQHAQSNFAYKVIGKIKSDADLGKNERNGFLRVDFFSEQPDGFKNRAVSTYVSKRVYGKSGWHEVTVEGIASKNVKFFTVSFQADQGKSPFRLGEVEIFESTGEIGGLQPYEEYAISDDDFFNPNDGGFL